MNENIFLAKAVSEQLHSGKPVVLISVISLQGSAPRHEGTAMLIDVNGKTSGTIGGSLIEAAAVEQARNVFKEKRSRVLSFDLAGNDANSSGMICGGKAEILLDYLIPSAENRELSSHWYETTIQGKEFYFITHFQGKNESFKVLGHAIVSSNKPETVSTSLTPEEIDGLIARLSIVSSNALLELKGSVVMVSRVCKLKTLYCFGAGHVAVPTVHFASKVGFRTIVIDDRTEYANAERFPEVQKIITVDDFNRALDGFEIDEDSYIVIFTRGHQYDRIVLEQAIKKSPGYIGMISSKRKRQAIYDALMESGVPKEKLDRVHSPIGLDIGAETPEEIAVSIVAELIKVRNEPQQ